jgi:hypothetical protein
MQTLFTAPVDKVTKLKILFNEYEVGEVAERLLASKEGLCSLSFS